MERVLVVLVLLGIAGCDGLSIEAHAQGTPAPPDAPQPKSVRPVQVGGGLFDIELPGLPPTKVGQVSAHYFANSQAVAACPDVQGVPCEYHEHFYFQTAAYPGDRPEAPYPWPGEQNCDVEFKYRRIRGIRADDEGYVTTLKGASQVATVKLVDDLKPYSATAGKLCAGVACTDTCPRTTSAALATKAQLSVGVFDILGKDKDGTWKRAAQASVHYFVDGKPSETCPVGVDCPIHEHFFLRRDYDAATKEMPYLWPSSLYPNLSYRYNWVRHVDAGDEALGWDMTTVLEPTKIKMQ